jgi:hypothetical protein
MVSASCNSVKKVLAVNDRSSIKIGEQRKVILIMTSFLCLIRMPKNGCEYEGCPFHLLSARSKDPIPHEPKRYPVQELSSVGEHGIAGPSW